MADHAARYDVLIVGGGVAAGACASTLRDEGYTGSVAVVCAEPHAPYTRPGLTKQVLRGEKPASAALWRPREWYAEHDVTLLSGEGATAIDVRGHSVRVAGRSIGYGTLVLATGAEPRLLTFAPELADRVHVVRSFADADDIRPHLGADTHWLVIGGGFIGAEFAASARLTGSEVSLVMPETVIMEGPFGNVTGGWFDQRLRDRGVHVHAGTTATSFELVGDKVHVTLGSGGTVEVDRIVVGVGVAPSTGLAAQAGLDLELGGIAVDQQLRASAPDVYAAGDVAAFDSVLHGERVRIEHWDVARAHGAYVGRRIAGTESGPFRDLPYFFGTMGDWAFLEYIGLATGRAVARGSLDDDTMAIAYLDDDDRLCAFITVGRADDLASARELVPERPVMDVDAIADADHPLASCQRRTAGVAP